MSVTKSVRLHDLEEDGLDADHDHLINGHGRHPEYFEMRCFRIARRILSFFYKFCSLEMQKPVCKEARQVNECKQIDCPQVQRQPIWSHLIRLFYVYMTIKTSCICYLQHNYDHNRKLLMRYIFQYGRQSSVELSELQRKLEDTRKQLKTIGAPYMNLEYIIQLALAYLIFAILSFYAIPQIYYRQNSIDYSLFRYLLDPEREQRTYVNKTIRDEVNTFILSRRNFTRAARLRLVHMEHGKASHSMQLRLIDSNYEQYKLADNHKQLAGQLRAMMLSGALQPFNRRPEWLRRTALGIIHLTVGNLLFSVLFLTLIGVILPFINFFPSFRLELDPPDILFLIEIAVFCAILVIAGSNYLVIMVMSCLDQKALAKGNTKQINRCIQQNDMMFRRYIRVRSWSNQPFASPRLGYRGAYWTKQHNDRYFDDICSMMNGNLLHCYMHFKIFVAQLGPFQRSSRLLIYCTIFMMTFPSICISLYVSNLPIASRLFVAFATVALVYVGNIYIASLCILHEDCMKTCRALTSLLAHTTGLTHLTESWTASSGDDDEGGPLNGGRVLYDKHLVCLLRKELSHPDRLTDQFATKALGVSLTHQNLVRLNFYISLLVLSMTTVESTWRLV